MTTGKTIALTRWTFVGKVMSLLLNMLSRLVITFLSRSKLYVTSGELKLIQQDTSSYLLEWPKSKTQTPDAGKDMEQQELSFIAGNTKWYSYSGR